jgi:retron-type reverse transcriptase
MISYSSLYRAWDKCKLGKRYKREKMDFEIGLTGNLAELSEELENETYKTLGYYRFKLYEPKEREVAAAHFRDRVVFHSLCDNILSPLLSRRVIFDNAACQIGKGTHFAIKRVRKFMSEYYKKYGSQAYILKCDISKYFDNIDHDILKEMLKKVPFDEQTYALIEHIIDSYSSDDVLLPSLGKRGLPLGNQTSQWFAVFYLNSLDRMVKEKLRVKYYSRYMDDFILIHHDRSFLENALKQIEKHVKSLNLSLNPKTQIIPLKNGFDYIGWNFRFGENGKIVMRLRTATKRRFYKRLDKMIYDYKHKEISALEIKQTLMSYRGLIKHGDTNSLLISRMNKFVIGNDAKKYRQNQREGITCKAS